MSRCLKTSCWLLLAATSVSLSVSASDEPAILQSVEAAYSSESAKADAAIAKAEQEAAKARKAAAEVRLKAYKERLAEVTKAGDFDKAVAVKARIEQLEKEPEGALPKSPTPPKRARPKDAVKFGGHAYALIKEPATWHIAKLRCEEMGGHLAFINSDGEEAFIGKLCGKTTAWIGATDEGEEGKWHNIDGTPLSLTHALYDNAGTGEHWMTWDGISQHFNDLSTNARGSYVCEWDR